MTTRGVSIILVAALMAVAGGRAWAHDQARLRLRAFAVNMSGVGPARAGMLDIVVERWSTDRERDEVQGALVRGGGPGALMAALQRMSPRAGYIRSANSMGWTIRYARAQILPDGSRRIVVLTERPLPFRVRPRWGDHEFAVAEIRIGRDGRGQGKLCAAAQLGWNQRLNGVEVVTYGSEPIRLTRVSVD